MFFADDDKDDDDDTMGMLDYGVTRLWFDGSI